MRDLSLYNLRAEGAFDASLYNDIEVNDFNQLFMQESIISN
jgi:hypothetical protein